MELERDKLEPSRYAYLNIEDSKLYDSVKNSEDPKDKQIKRLLEEKARGEQAAHCRCKW